MKFSTHDGTADAGRDFSNTVIFVSFPKDTTTLTQTVPVTIRNNTTVERTEETFTVTLQAPSSGLPTYVRLGRSQATVKILDDDEATIEFSHNTIRARENQEVHIVLQVSTNPRSSCSVDYPFDAHFSYTDLHDTFSSEATIPSSLSYRRCGWRRGFSIPATYLANRGVVTGPTEVVFNLSDVTSTGHGLEQTGDGRGPIRVAVDYRGL